jgi:hypothetical protein
VSEGLVKTGMMEYLHSINFQHKPMSEITSGLHRGIYHQALVMK